MKILEFNFKKEISASRSAIMWNYWDHEHLIVVHNNYVDAKIIYENNYSAAYILSFKLPVLSFIKSNSLNVMIMEDKNTIKHFNSGLFQIPVHTTVKVDEIRTDHSTIEIKYEIFLQGWRKLLSFFISGMVKKWNDSVWMEDLPLKLRRTKVQRIGFKDFIGLPKNIKDRKVEGEINFELPLNRHIDSPVNIKKKDTIKLND